jgi:hypothetical protein
MPQIAQQQSREQRPSHSSHSSSGAQVFATKQVCPSSQPILSVYMVRFHQDETGQTLGFLTFMKKALDKIEQIEADDGYRGGGGSQV